MVSVVRCSNYSRRIQHCAVCVSVSVWASQQVRNSHVEPNRKARWILVCHCVVWWWWWWWWCGRDVTDMSVDMPSRVHLIRVAEHLGVRLPASPPPGTHVSLHRVRKMPQKWGGATCTYETCEILPKSLVHWRRTCIHCRTRSDEYGNHSWSHLPGISAILYSTSEHRTPYQWLPDTRGYRRSPGRARPVQQGHRHPTSSQARLLHPPQLS